MPIEPGSKVYTEDGYAWIYICEIPDGGHVVSAAYEEGYSEHTKIVGTVWPDEPPTHQLSAEHAKLTEQLAAVRDELALARRELAEIPKRLEALKGRSAALDRIEDFIEGRITHAVVARYGRVEIKTLEEVLKGGDGGDRGDRTQRLVALYGDTKGDLNWNINRYRDGSGGWETITPATSEEDAREEAQRLIEGLLADKPHIADTLIASADVCGVTVPPAVRADAWERRHASLEKSVDRTTAELRKALEARYAHGDRPDLEVANESL